MRAHYSIVLTSFYAIIGFVEVSDKPEGGTANRVELFSLKGTNGYIEGSRVATSWVVSVPKIAQQGDIRKRDDFERLLMNFTPLVVFNVITSEQGIELSRQFFES